MPVENIFSNSTQSDESDSNYDFEPIISSLDNDMALIGKSVDEFANYIKYYMDSINEVSFFQGIDLENMVAHYANYIELRLSCFAFIGIYSNKIEICRIALYNNVIYRSIIDLHSKNRAHIWIRFTNLIGIEIEDRNPDAVENDVHSFLDQIDSYLLNILIDKSKNIKNNTNRMVEKSIYLDKSFEERLNDIDSYVINNPGKPVSQYIISNNLFPEFSSFEKNNNYKLEIPKVAQELYNNRNDKNEDAPAFIKRVYKDYIGKGLTRAILDKLDHKVVARIDYLRSERNTNKKTREEAVELDLPTAWAAPRKWADRVLAGEETVPEFTDAKTFSRNASRLAKARKRADFGK